MVREIPMRFRFYPIAIMMVMLFAVPLVMGRSARDGVEGRTFVDEFEQGPWIVAYPSEKEAVLRAEGVSIWDREGSTVVGTAEEAQVSNLSARGIDPIFKVADHGELLYILEYEEGFRAPAALGARSLALSETGSLYLFPSSQSFDLPRTKPFGGFRGVPRTPLPAAAPHDSDTRTAFATNEILAINPLVTQIVNNTSQANWYQYVKDLSGENSVVIGGNTFTIRTRYSDAMFPVLSATAHATEYLEDKGAGWGYTSVRENYATVDSGCSQSGGHVWQNLVFTLPGQVDFGQHQQVIFVTHYDSLSFSDAESRNFAPGADDAISGGSALIEALRLFKDYGFKNTVKIIFFSGEEQGLCGSVAYTRQHPAADMWRVVNMDQTAYDGNKNGWMNDYNWDATNSPGSVALGAAFVQANSDYGPIINPANIFRPTNKMCQTDHCPFWNVGVAAIAITEDLMHSEICPCFDQGQTTTCHDTVTQDDPTHPGQLMFDQNFSWPSQKTAIATVAALAEPLYACPASAPAPTLTPGNNKLHVAWPTAPGVTNYVVERAATCAGPFTAITSATGTTYDDLGVTNGTSYAYRIRTCPTQTGACVTASPQAGPSVVYQSGSAAVVADTGDHDVFADNCELTTVQVNLVNDGNVPLTGVKLSGVASSHPGVEVASILPQTIGSLGVGASAPATFKFYMGRNGSPAACADPVPFTVTSSSDQAPLDTRGFALTAEKDTTSGSFTYGFESDLSGWTVTNGTFTRVAGGAPGSTAFSLHSRNANSICDSIVSPVVTPTGSSTMTMWVNFSIESGNFDRAVVQAINTNTGVKTLLVPTGALYTTTGCGGVTLCDNLCNKQGWSGTATTWRQASFNLGAFNGIPIQIEVRFSTDTNTLGTQGFWFDAVQINNVTQSGCDAQADACSALPAEVSPDASPVQFTIGKSGGNYNLRFSEVAGATAYNLYGGSLSSLHAGGTYDHAAAGGICALTDGTPGNGEVLGSVPAATLPANGYFLVAAKNASGESVYGKTSTGAVIPVAVQSCP